MMMLDYDVRLFDIYVQTSAIDGFLLSVQDTQQIKDVNGINGPPWTLDRVKEWTVYGLGIYVYECVTYDQVYYDVVYGLLKCFVDGCRLMIVC